MLVASKHAARVPVVAPLHRVESQQIAARCRPRWLCSSISFVNSLGRKKLSKLRFGIRW